jgi:1-acyl-sn-glycerol-3-phosphate acyltransferase
MAHRRPWYRFIAWLARNVLFRPLGGFRVTGRENVPMEGPVIIAPIHVSYLDPMLVGAVSPREISFMAKEELFRNPIMNKLIRSLNTFPVKRGQNDSSAIREALRLIESGRALLVFPEGTRGNGEQMGAIQGGLMMMARRTGAQILPVGIWGTHKAWPRGQKMRRHKTALHFGKPFTLADIGERPSREEFSSFLAEKLHEACLQAGLELKMPAAPELPKASAPLEKSSESSDPSQA